jgi:arylsulfatase
MEDLIKLMPVADIPEGGIYRYYPQTSPVPEFAAAEIRGRSFKILADVELTDDSEGVLLANGARFGGHTLFIKDHKLWYVNNFLGIKPEQVLTSPDVLPTGAHVLGVEFSKESHGSRGEALGTATLYVDDLAVAKSDWKTQPGHFALCGEGLTVGRDSSDPVTQEYGAPYAFTGGRIKVVEINIGDDVYVDRERDFHAAMSRD